MKHDLSKIKEELTGLPEYDTQIYLQGKEKGIDPTMPAKGRTWEEIDKEENKGKYQLRGCCVSGNDPDYGCNDCGEEF